MSSLYDMDAFFEPKNIKYLSSRQPDIDSAQDIIAYLKMEYYDMLLYASKEVIKSVKIFITNPNRNNFIKAVLAMRRDLWDKKTILEINDIVIDITSNQKM